MSGYPREWLGSTEPDNKAGQACYTVDGRDYLFNLESFKDFELIGELLEASFQQGKRFAAKALRSHIETAMTEAQWKHDL